MWDESSLMGRPAQFMPDLSQIWHGRSLRDRIREFAGQRVQLRFLLRSASLYAVTSKP